MERYFEVMPESGLHKEWFEYKENALAVRKLANSFFNQKNIGATEYYAADDAIYIVPTDEDKENFKSVLLKPLENGLCQFRKSSKINKAWVQALKDAELSVDRKPMVILYFRFGGGRYKSRLFDQGEKLYCSIDPADGEPPEGFVEMKASEFYKIVEDNAA